MCQSSLVDIQHQIRTAQETKASRVAADAKRETEVSAVLSEVTTARSLMLLPESGFAWPAVIAVVWDFTEMVVSCCNKNELHLLSVYTFVCICELASHFLTPQRTATVISL